MNTELRHNYDKIWTDVYGDIQDHGPVHRHMRRILGTLVGSIEYESVLDVGCGLGHNLPLLCKGRRMQRITGVDISSLAIQQVQQIWGQDFYQLDIQKGGLGGCWDLVFSSLLLEHLPDDLAALRNMRAMTGKYLLLTTIAGSFQRYKNWERQMGHVRNYEVGELEGKLEKVGYIIQKVIYWGFPFYSPIARVLQNNMKASSKFEAKSRIFAQAMYLLYFLNSNRQGDLSIVLASV
jgi:SAM-dependent methyltransferase